MTSRTMAISFIKRSLNTFNVPALHLEGGFFIPLCSLSVLFIGLILCYCFGAGISRILQILDTIPGVAISPRRILWRYPLSKYLPVSLATFEISHSCDWSISTSFFLISLPKSQNLDTLTKPPFFVLTVTENSNILKMQHVNY